MIELCNSSLGQLSTCVVKYHCWTSSESSHLSLMATYQMYFKAHRSLMT